MLCQIPGDYAKLPVKAYPDFNFIDVAIKFVIGIFRWAAVGISAREGNNGGEFVGIFLPQFHGAVSPHGKARDAPSTGTVGPVFLIDVRD